jgi:sugar phosphate isomerase/epimerase
MMNKQGRLDHMIGALNPVTTGNTTLTDFLNAAHQAGFSAVEYDIAAFERLSEEQSIAAVKELLRSKQLDLASIGLPVEFRKDEASFQQDLSLLSKRARLARELGVERCCTWLMPTTDEPVVEYTLRTVSRLRQCAKVLNQEGIRFGLEWVGPKTLRTKTYDFVHTLQGALDLIDAINESNVGLLFDSFHWFTTSGTVQDIMALDPKQIVMVHINDAPDKPVHEQVDKQRLLPGEGIIQLTAMLEALKSIGYNNYISVETFSDQLPLLGANEAAIRAKQALQNVFDESEI